MSARPAIGYRPASGPAAGTVPPTEFREVMSRVPTGVTIVTTRDHSGVPYGFTAGTLCSVSLRPPLVSVCLDTTARCFPVFQRCDLFTVSVLHRQQVEIATRFADREAEKFAAGGFHDTDAGIPAVDDALAVLECRAYCRFSAGDHLVIVGEVYRANAGDGMPLLFVRRSFTQPEETEQERPT